MPAFNAARTIDATIRRLPWASLKEAGWLPRVYVVDDGSTDGTGRQARQTKPLVSCPFRVLAHKQNRGYGAAQKTGLTASLEDGNTAHVILHADGQYAPEEMVNLLEPMLRGTAHGVIGSRFKKGRVLAQGMPLARMLGIRLLDNLENFIFGLDGMEFHSGYMGYTTPVLDAVPFEQLTDRFHFDGQMVLCAAKAGFDLKLVPISTFYGPDTSSLAPLSYLLEVTGVLLEYLGGGMIALARVEKGRTTRGERRGGDQSGDSSS